VAPGSPGYGFRMGLTSSPRKTFPVTKFGHTHTHTHTHEFVATANEKTISLLFYISFPLIPDSNFVKTVT
jgi:hypothetical protein